MMIPRVAVMAASPTVFSAGLGMKETGGGISIYKVVDGIRGKG